MKKQNSEPQSQNHKTEFSKPISEMLAPRASIDRVPKPGEGVVIASPSMVIPNPDSTPALPLSPKPRQKIE